MPMPLNEMSLSDLEKIADGLNDLKFAGRQIDRAGLGPVLFDLTPGGRATLSFACPLPALAATALAMAFADTFTISTEAEPPEPALDPVAAPLAAEGPVEGATQTAEPTDDAEASRHLPQVAAASKGEAESGGGQARAAAEASAAPIPGSASAMAATWQAPLWTAEEDAKLIALVVSAVAEHGLSRNAAAVAAARELGRAEEGVKFRCKTKLKARIDAAISDAAMTQAQTETPEIPATEVRPVPEMVEDAAVGGHSPAAVQDAPSAEVLAAAFARPMAEVPDDLHGKDRDLWQYLQAHRPRWPHTAGTDLDLVVGLSRGDKLPMLAADLGIDPAKLKERFQTLTRPIQDAKGHITIDGGPRLITLLRRIVKTPAEAA
jgi:hypothetical protein